MKSITITLLLFFTLLIGGELYSQVNPKTHWENFTTQDGLLSNDIRDILIEDSFNIWIATDLGLSHFDGTNFTNYSKIPGGLNSNDLTDLVLSQNKLWIASDSGITSFDGTSFINYTSSNGLLSGPTLGIASSSADTLWVLNQGGVSKFDGTFFTNYTAQTGKDIEVDDQGRVYVLKYTFIDNTPFPLVHMYENGVWTQPMHGAINYRLNQAEFRTTNDGDLFIVSNGGDGSQFSGVTYPFNLTKFIVKRDNNTPTPPFGSISNTGVFEKNNGRFWIGSAYAASDFLLTGTDSIFSPQFVSTSFVESNSIDIEAGIMVVGSDQGIYITTPTKKNPPQEIELSTNQIRTSVVSTDPLFFDRRNSLPNFEFPKDSNSHGIYAANFIVAGKKVNQSSYVVHPLNGFTQAFAPGPQNNVGGLPNGYMVKVSQQEIMSHQSNFNQPGYMMPAGIKDWLAYGDTTLGIATDLAPFVDANSNGCYDPLNGDYPIIKGDEAIYWINTPNNQNLEFEYHWMMYAFDQPSNKGLNQSIFLQYTIINRSNSAYDSVKVGLYVDGDLGNFADDYVGSDSVNNILYFYNGSTFDNSMNGYNGYGKTTPALGIKFLSDSLANSLYYNSGAANNGDPQTSQDWVNYMNSRWRNGQSLFYGGDGHASSGTSTTPTTHMFTGDPYNLTGWTEQTPGGGQSRNPEGDRRLFGSIPYFSLQPNERRSIEIAVGYGRTTDTSSVIGKNIAEMVSVLNQAKSYWDNISLPAANFASTDSCNAVTSLFETTLTEKQELELFPVPATDLLQIRSKLDFNEIQLYDMKGALVKVIPTKGSKITIDVSELNEGIYFLNALSDEGIESKKFVIMR